jgi:hypothetical protein
MSGSQFRALTIQSGVTTQIQSTNQLLVGNGIDADAAGALSIGATTATSITLNQNTSMPGAQTFSTGTGAVSLNGATSVTGSNTFTVGTGLTTLGGALTQSGGAFSLTGNAASQLSTTAGALTITAASDSTWSTSAGVLTVSGTAGLNLAMAGTTYLDVGTMTTGAVTLVNNTNFVAATGTSAFDFHSSTGTFQTSSGAVSVNGNTTFTGSTSVTVHAFNTAGVVHNNASGLLSTSLINVTNDITPGTAGQVLLTNGTPAAAWTTVSQDATISATGAVTVVSAQGNFTVGAAGSGNLTIDGTGSFTTGTGTNTINGNVTTGNNPNFDFSGSTGTFKTSQGANTLTGATTASSTLTSTGLLTASNGLTVSSGNITTPLTNWGTVQVNGSGVLTSSAGSSAQLLIAQGSAPATWNTLSGDGYINASGVLTVTQAAGNFEVKGNLMVDGAETIVGTSTFQSNALFDGDVTVADGYYLQTQTLQSGGSDVLTINGAGGTNLQVGGSNYLQVGTVSSNVITVPSGITLEAASGGQIIATSSSGTEEITVTGVNTSAVGAANDAVYVSGSLAVSSAEANSLSTAYCAGFAKDKTASGNLYTDGLVTPNITGSASPGNVMYLDPANAGKVTATAPTTVGQVVAPVGFMLSSTQMVIRILTPVQL